MGLKFIHVSKKGPSSVLCAITLTDADRLSIQHQWVYCQDDYTKFIDLFARVITKLKLDRIVNTWKDKASFIAETWDAFYW